ncbi:hypothetical protein [Aerosakkonema funiforme]|uniref:hypothetical protein n=1 Tax=Aerosakkonema funiforme TaxID=1246630 RepID=UPI0018EFCCB0|nr:hypothetical protein [Aerosakkonema funiforme]
MGSTEIIMSLQNIDWLLKKVKKARGIPGINPQFITLKNIKKWLKKPAIGVNI